MPGSRTTASERAPRRDAPNRPLPSGWRRRDLRHDQRDLPERQPGDGEPDRPDHLSSSRGVRTAGSTSIVRRDARPAGTSPSSDAPAARARRGRRCSPFRARALRDQRPALERREPEVQERGGVGEWLAGLSEHHREQRSSPRTAVATMQKPAALVNPVFTPIAPGYSHRSTLRFWTIRASPSGAGIACARVATMLRESRDLVRGPREAREIARGRVPRVIEPVRRREPGPGEPESAAVSFISSTNPSTVPPRCSATATGGVVRRLQHQRVQELLDPDLLAGLQPQVRDAHDLLGRGVLADDHALPRLGAGHHEVGRHDLRQARDRPRSDLGFSAYRVCPVSRSTRIADPAGSPGARPRGPASRRIDGKGEGEVPPPGTGTGVGGGGSRVWARVRGDQAAGRDEVTARARPGSRRRRAFAATGARDTAVSAGEVLLEVRAQQRLFELAGRLARDRSTTVAATRRASGFRWRSCGSTIVSKNEDSRSAKCLYIVRCRGSTPNRKKSFTIESTM